MPLTAHAEQLQTQCHEWKEHNGISITQKTAVRMVTRFLAGNSEEADNKKIANLIPGDIGLHPCITLEMTTLIDRKNKEDSTLLPECFIQLFLIMPLQPNSMTDRECMQATLEPSLHTRLQVSCQWRDWYHACMTETI
jgi:hypothetical protein